MCKVFKWYILIKAAIRIAEEDEMKLSMWIVSDWLQPYHPEVHIREGQQIITGVRYLVEDLQLNRDYLYIGYSDQYIDDLGDQVICVNGSDLIILDAPDIYVIFNEIQKMLEYYNSWETGLIKAINSTKGLDFFLDSTTEVFRTGIAVSDLSHKAIYYAAYQQHEEKLQLKQGYLDPGEMQVINWQMQEHIEDRSPYFVQSSQDQDILFNIYSKSGRLMACLVSLSGGEGRGVQSRLQLMDVFGQLINLWFLVHEDGLSEQSLFRDILEMKETDPEIIALRLQGIGWGSQPDMQLLILRPCAGISMGIPYIQRVLESTFAGVQSLYYLEEYLVIVNYQLTEQEAFFQELIALMKRQSVYCGCSHRFSDLNNLMQNYLQASCAADYGIHEAGGVNHCEDYAVEYMKAKLRDAVDTKIVSPSLEKLRKYDIENGTEYYHTLYVYLLCERNQTLAAQKLYIHRNSLIYRIGRIEEIIHRDLNEERERLYLLLSFLVEEKEGVRSV